MQNKSLNNDYKTPTPTPSLTPTLQIMQQPMSRDILPSTTKNTAFETQQMEVQQILATMFPTSQKIAPPVRPNKTTPINTIVVTPELHPYAQPFLHNAVPSPLQNQYTTRPDDYDQTYYDEQMYSTQYNQLLLDTPKLTPTTSPSPFPQQTNLAQPTYPQNTYLTRNTHYGASQYHTSNVATESSGFQALSSVIRIKPSLTLDQAEFLKTEVDFEWKSIDFKREFCFLHFADGEAASRALHYFDSIKQIPEYSFLRHYDASMYLKPQGKEDKRKY